MFAEIASGDYFNDGRRTFIKLVTQFPSGIKIDGYQTIVNGKSVNGLFNSVDDKGIPATCPDWVEFNLGKL